MCRYSREAFISFKQLPVVVGGLFLELADEPHSKAITDVYSTFLYTPHPHLVTSLSVATQSIIKQKT